MSDEDLMVKLQGDKNFNPWIGQSDVWNQIIKDGKFERNCFVLDVDKDSFEKANLKGAEINRRLRGDILPQPFVGNPAANVWVLMRNPGLGALDYYDLVSTENWEGYRDGLDDEDWRPIDTNKLYFKDPEIAKTMLCARQQKVMDQLTFNFANARGKEFYLLDECFQTYDTTGAGRRIYGGRHWYQTYFCTDEVKAQRSKQSDLSVLSRNVFVLDYCPYHSCFYQERRVKFAHMELWSRLIRYGLESKVLVVRGSDILNKVKKVDFDLYNQAVSANRLFVFSGQNAWLTSGNLARPCSADCFRMLFDGDRNESKLEATAED